MESLKDVMKKSFPFQDAGENVCDQCGNTYKLYQTSRGIMGACKPCADKELLKRLDLPTQEEYEKMKEQNFILSFENVTSDLETATVNNYKPKQESQLNAKQITIQFINEFDGEKSLLFSGDPGLGKSHLAYAIAKAVRAKGKKVLYIKVTDLLDKIKSSYSPKSSITEAQIFQMLNELDLLVMDDIGSEYVKKNDSDNETWASDVLFKIFDMRSSKSNICTTNYHETELKHKYGKYNGPRIMSRMLNKTDAIRLEGEDFRRKAAF